MRIFELKILKDKIPSNQLFEFIRKFNVVSCGDLYINLLTKKEKDNPIFKSIGLPIDNYYLDDNFIESFLNFKV